VRRCQRNDVTRLRQPFWIIFITAAAGAPLAWPVSWGSGVAPGLTLQNGCRAVSHGRSGGAGELDHAWVAPGSVARTAPWRV